jgi:hypothetical protein
MKLLRGACLTAAFLLATGHFSALANDDDNDNSELNQRIERRIKFFQEHFNQFVPVRFEPTTNISSVIQKLKVKEHTFDFEGKHYCGFRFTVPEWSDGDFWWLNLLDKKPYQKDFTTQDFEWYIVPEKGRMTGFSFYSFEEVRSIYSLFQSFPNTVHFFYQKLDKDRFIPGATYAIWFGFKEADLPDIAFTLTIDSNRGHKEFGGLPVFPQDNPKGWKAPLASPEPDRVPKPAPEQKPEPPFSIRAKLERAKAPSLPSLTIRMP